MDQVFVFDKCLQERLEEYKDLLSGYDILPVTSLQKEWAFFLEMAVDPNGWQALWKIDRRTCEALEIPFPSVVLVLVLNVDFKELTAMVKVLAVQDDIHIPDKHCVQIIHLWPTKEQDKTIALNLEMTANSIDMLRFFYNHLFMPWDFEDDDDVDWKAKHLEPRLRLYYDMKNGVLPRVTAEHIFSLTSEAKRLQAKRHLLEAELADTDDSDADKLSTTNSDSFQNLMEVHIRMMEIKAEVDILEHPLLRRAIINKQKEMLDQKPDQETERSYWLIYNKGSATECINFLAKVESLYPTETLKFSSQLATALECGNSNDTFILNEDNHFISTVGALEHGGLLKGVSARENTVLHTKIEDVMLDFRGENIEVENLTINAFTPQCGIIIRKGSVTIKNCKLVGNGKSSTRQGIIVLNGGKLKLINCDVSNFCTAIVGNSGSEVTIENSEIYDCNFGLRIYDNSVVKVVQTTIRNCKDYGICLETENNVNNDGQTVGSFDTLNIIPKVKMESLKGNNNLKGDAIINQKSKLQPLDDLFDKSNTDPTICIESDEEMDCLHTTVIEKSNNGVPV